MRRPRSNISKRSLWSSAPPSSASTLSLGTRRAMTTSPTDSGDAARRKDQRALRRIALPKAAPPQIAPMRSSGSESLSPRRESGGIGYTRDRPATGTASSRRHAQLLRHCRPVSYGCDGGSAISVISNESGTMSRDRGLHIIAYRLAVAIGRAVGIPQRLASIPGVLCRLRLRKGIASHTGPSATDACPSA